MLTAEDRVAIQDLYTRYCWSIDTADATAWVETFTEDGVFEANGQVTTGRAALEDWVRARIQQRVTEPTVSGQHFISNIDVDGDVRSARARAYWMRTVHVRDTGAVQVVGTGWFDDELRKINGRWRFKRHTASKQVPWLAPEAPVAAGAPGA